MKKRILVSLMFSLVICSMFVFLNWNNTSAEITTANDDKVVCMTVTLTGTGSSSATVRARHISTSTDYYLTQDSGNPNVYRKQHGMENGNYNIYACSNSNTSGYLLNQTLNIPSTEIHVTIPLSGGSCPFGD